MSFSVSMGKILQAQSHSQDTHAYVLKRLYAHVYPLGGSASSNTGTNKKFTFLINNFALPSVIIARFYKCRWQIEISFK